MSYTTWDTFLDNFVSLLRFLPLVTPGMAYYKKFVAEKKPYYRFDWSRRLITKKGVPVQSKRQTGNMPPLSSHPIFKVRNEALGSFKQNRRRNIVAFKGTEVYIALGSTVLCAELRDWYAMDGEPKDDKKYYQVSPPTLSWSLTKRL
jgi:hypothetical protein